MLIERRLDLARLKQALPRVILTGRRKTGKTTLAKMLSWPYYYVLPTGMIQTEGELISPSSFATRLTRLLQEEEPFILDEIHRLPRHFLYLFHSIPKGEYVLITSSLSFMERIQQDENPLLGIAIPLTIDLIHPADLLPALKHYPPVERIERALFYQEPSLIPFLEGKPLSQVIHLKDLLYGLLTEALSEDRVRLNQRLLGIFRAMSRGYWRTGEIASFLTAEGIITQPSAGAISPYLAILKRLRLIEEQPIWQQKKRSYRRVTSPFFTFILKHDDQPAETAETRLQADIPLLLEGFFERLFQLAYQGRPVRILTPEVDIAYAENKRTLSAVGEVKWRQQLKTDEVKRIREKLRALPAREAFLITKTPFTTRGEDLTLYTPEAIIHHATILQNRHS